MADNHQAERCRCSQFCDLLKTGEATHIIFKILRKLIPDKYKFLQIILCDHFTNPIAQFLCVHGKVSSDRLNLKYFINQSAQSVIVIGFQLC